jgi:hypothetical protein
MLRFNIVGVADKWDSNRISVSVGQLHKLRYVWARDKVYIRAILRPPSSHGKSLVLVRDIGISQREPLTELKYVYDLSIKSVHIGETTRDE